VSSVHWALSTSIRFAGRKYTRAVRDVRHFLEVIDVRWHYHLTLIWTEDCRTCYVFPGWTFTSILVYLCLVVLVLEARTNQTDRQADGRTDGRARFLIWSIMTATFITASTTVGKR